MVLTLSVLAESGPTVVPGCTSLFIVGTADGPSVTKIIVELSEEAQSVSAEGLTLITADTKYEVAACYLCDLNGEAVESSNLVAFEIGEQIVEEAEDGASAGFNPFSGSVFGRDASLSLYDVTPTDEGGGSLTAGGYDNIFAWLNDQSK